MAIPAMTMLQQHDAQRDIVIEPAARRHAAIEARGHSELGAQSGRKTNRLVCLSVCLSVWRRTEIDELTLTPTLTLLRND